MSRSRRVLVLSCALALLPALPALPGGSTSVQERAFRVDTRPAQYGVSPTTRQLTVRASDGTTIFTETWLPAAKAGHVPPKRVPVVVVVTPYAFKGLSRPDRLNTPPRWRELIVGHGFALANVHLRGTGESGGCWGAHDAQDADDASRAIAALAAAPYSSGRLLLWGKSYDGGAAVNVLERGAPERLRSVRAALLASPFISFADESVYDGVSRPATAATSSEVNLQTSLIGRSAEYKVPEEYVTHGNKDPAAAAARMPCRVDDARGTVSDGRVTPWMLERELAAWTDRIRVPVLMTYGLQEGQTRMIDGAFDGIRTRKVGVFAQSGHDYPDENTDNATFSRLDFEAMAVAWLDRYGLGSRPEVDRWPTVQVQDTTGAWRAESAFPQLRGPRGQLALGAGGVLGTTRPAGSDTYVQTTKAAADELVLNYDTPVLTDALHLSGQLVADLWVTTDRLPTDLSLELKIRGPDGSLSYVDTAARSMSYLAPFVNQRFVQQQPVDPPLGSPVHVVVRFRALDLVVPRGSRLGIGVGSLVDAVKASSVAPAQITLLHDCAHPSALRFSMPVPALEALDVVDARSAQAVSAGLRDGAGLATAPVCGRGPS